MKNPHAQALGRLGGKAKSKAKTEAAKRNAKLPRKSKMRLALELAYDCLESNGDPLSRTGQAITAIEAALKPRKRKGTK